MIRDPVPFWPLDPGWVKIKFRIRDGHPGSYFRELRSGIRDRKILIRYPGQTSRIHKTEWLRVSVTIQIMLRSMIMSVDPDLDGSTLILVLVG